MKKLPSFAKKILLLYAVFIGVILIAAIYTSASLQLMERNGWDYFIFSKSALVLIPTTLAITMLVMKKINLNAENESITNNGKKGKTILFVIAIIVNYMLLLAAAHQSAIIYNILGPAQQEVLIEGNITAVKNKTKKTRKGKRHRSVTVFDITQQREITFKSKHVYETNTQFKETLMKGSLGFLYKRH